MTMSRYYTLTCLLLSVGCGRDASTEAVASSRSALSCFHTDSEVLCAETDSLSEETRIRVEDFYPSACFDGDRDEDGTPDFLDIDDSGSDSDSDLDDSDEDAGATDDADDDDADSDDDDLQCPHCNRGPGTQGDFRLRIEGTDGELERGKVLAVTDGSLTVPTPDGVLTIAITPDTEIEDGTPSPGAEIRAEGTMEGSTLTATRLKVLCPGAPALPDGEVPPEATPPQPDPSEPVPPVIVE